MLYTLQREARFHMDLQLSTRSVVLILLLMKQGTLIQA